MAFVGSARWPWRPFIVSTKRASARAGTSCAASSSASRSWRFITATSVNAAAMSAISFSSRMTMARCSACVLTKGSTRSSTRHARGCGMCRRPARWVCEDACRANAAASPQRSRATIIMDAAITGTGVHKRYRSVHALQGLDLTIRRGEFFGLLGPNGAGKSTLINIIAGLLRADSGQVAVLGHDVVGDYRRARARLGVVPQELVFDPFFTVREVLRIQAGYFGLGAENEPWLDELLAALDLSGKAGSNMRSLSGGMKRRVLIAQALVHKPEVLVLDEPTAGVDVELRQSLWQFVKRLHREGHTIVLTTHYLEEAEALCDRIAIIDHGNLVALDSKQALLEKAMGARCRLTVILAAPLAAGPASLADARKTQDGIRLEFQLDKGRDPIVAALDRLRAAGATVVDLQTEEADLEDIFVELTHRNRQ